MRFLGVVVLCLSLTAFGQSRNVSFDPSNVAVTGGRADLTGGTNGCRVFVEFEVSVSGVRVTTDSAPVNPSAATCTALRNSLERAAMTKLGISDGGTP